MKKLLLIILSFFLTYSIYAQESTKETPAIYQKGRLMLGLSSPQFGYSGTIRDGSGNIVGGHLRFGGNLRTGLFVKDRWMLGLDLGYTFYANRGSDRNYNSINVAAFSRHYTPITDKLSFFAEVNAGYSTSFFSNQTDTWGHQSSVFLGASAGLSYQMSKRFSVEASMGYRLNLQSSSYDLITTGAKLGVNFHF